MFQWIDLVTGKKEMLKDIYNIVMRINKFYRAHMLNLCFFFIPKTSKSINDDQFICEIIIAK